jgi:hypothetical protein
VIFISESKRTVVMPRVPDCISSLDNQNAEMGIYFCKEQIGTEEYIFGNHSMGNASRRKYGHRDTNTICEPVRE